MRGRKNKRALDWRSRKRAILRALLFAAAPMMTVPLITDLGLADTPAAKSALVMPPLPLSGQPQAKGLQPNPFCQPSPVQSKLTATEQNIAQPALGYPQPVQNQFFDLSLSGVQLTSGSETTAGNIAETETTVRLLPVGTTAEAPAETAGIIRPNPMVIQEPTQVANSGAILLPVVPAEEKAAKLAAATEPALPPLVASPAVVAASEVVEPMEVAPVPTVVAAPPVAEEKPTKPSKRTKAAPWKPKAEPEQTDAASASTSTAPEGPISFSLNDAKLVETSGSEQTVAPQETSQPLPKNGSSFADILRKRDQAESRAGVPAKGTAVLGKATSPAQRLDMSARLTRGNSRTLLVPLDPVDDPKAMSSSTAPDKRIVKGARPRVDVGLPPVAIERASHDEGGVSIGPVAVDASDVNGRDSAFQTDAPVMIDLKSAEVRALKFESNILKVQIGDSSVCAAIAAGPSSIQLIGARDGMTRLAVWTATTSGKEQKTVYEVFVGATSRSTATEGNTIANTLTRSARAAFPTSNIQVRHEQGEMVVEGVCPDNDSAKQVLRMIRSACKLPVVDKLTVR